MVQLSSFEMLDEIVRVTRMKTKMEQTHTLQCNCTICNHTYTEEIIKIRNHVKPWNETF